MNKLYIIVVGLIIFGCNTKSENQSTSKVSDTFESNMCDVLKQSLHDFRASSSYIKFMVSDQKGQKSTVVVENTLFYSTYFAEKPEDQQAYTSMMYDCITQKRPIRLTDKQIEDLKSSMIDPGITVDEQVDKLVSQYFEDNVQKVTIPNKLSVISELIDNKYRVSVDDETGYLVLSICDGK